MNKKIVATIGFLTLGAFTVIGFQNCAGSSPSASASSAAASCKNQSILRNGYPQGKTFSIPLGVTNTPNICNNQSAYDTMVFNATTQTLTLSGSSGSKVFSLNTGGDACSGGAAIGGDRWKSASGEFIDTNLAADVLQIALNPDISCTVDR